MAKPTKETKQNDLAPYYTRLYAHQRKKLQWLKEKMTLNSEAEVIRTLIDTYESKK